MNNIVLCGFMGCGKTTVGKLIAKALAFTFIDMDDYIVEQCGMSINQLFETYGEAHFRKLETDTIRELSARSELVIATGGGAVMRDENVELLKAGGTLVYLEANAESVYERLKDDTTRPLLAVDNKRAKIEELLAARIPRYRRVADLCVDGGGPAEQVADTIVKALSR